MAHGRAETSRWEKLRKNILVIKTLHKVCLTIRYLYILWFYTTQQGFVSTERLIWALSTRGLSLNLQLQLNWNEYSTHLIRKGCSISIFRAKSWYVHNTYLYTIMKQTVTAENPWAFLEAKSSEGKMQLFRWLTCDATHQWWQPARIQWVYLHLKVKAIKNCSDFIKNMYRNAWKGINYLECYFPLLQETIQIHSHCADIHITVTDWLDDLMIRQKVQNAGTCHAC